MKTGLTEKQVLENRKKYGSNKISKIEKESFIKLLIATLGDPIIKILLIALAIKTLFLFESFDWYETIGIVIAIFLASFISSISEYGSNKAFEKLWEEAAKIKVKVRREGKINETDIEDIVVGDVICLQTGDEIPADGKVISGEVMVNESNLNGEMKEINKSENDKLYRSSVIYSGEALIEVTSVGDNTLYGKLAKEVHEKTPDSPLKIRLTVLAKQISKLGYLGALLVTFSYLFSVFILENNFNLDEIYADITNFPLVFGHLLHALTLSVTIIVVAVPEGLPMMITLVLSSNMKRMLKNNVLVRKLTGIETAGNINILFTDKTGTITKGKMEVIKIIDALGHTYSSLEKLKQNKNFYNLVHLACTANNSSIYTDNKIVGGNITDRALRKFFKSQNYNYKIVNVVPFSSKNKFSATEIKINDKTINLVKGAPEIIISNCSHYYDNNRKIGLFYPSKFKKMVNDLAQEGIRVLALATSENNRFNRLCLIGFVCIKDEVRKEALEGLKLINSAGIQTVMITGDNALTAKAIGKEVGLLTSDKDIVMTSQEFNNKTDKEIAEILPNLKILARSLPQDKSRLVKIARDNNLVVGMTGDGVNDAPALKKADVGFAMGSGTEVAKEASDIVILDDNLLSISNAVLYGRTIFKSIRKFIIFQLTINLCAVSISIIGPFIGVETPVTVIQMLWINMVMDTFAGLAFAFEPPLKEYMEEKPKKKNEQIINTYMKEEIMVTGTYSALLCVLFLKLPLFHHIFRDGVNDEYLLTAFFGLFIFMGIFNCFNARTHRLNLLANILKNKVFLLVIIFVLLVQIYLIYYGGNTFRTYGLNFMEFEIMVLLAMTVIPVDWARKLLLRRKGEKGGV